MDVQVTFAEVYIFRHDLGHLAYTETSTGQEEKDTFLTVVFGGFQKGVELSGRRKFSGSMLARIIPILLQTSDYVINQKFQSIASDH